MSHIEQMLCEEESRFAYCNGTPEFNQAIDSLSARFGGICPDGWYSVSTPQFNSIYGDDIVSAVIQAKPIYLDHLQPAAVGRKFFMRQGWVYDKVYLFIEPGAVTPPHPEGAQPMFVGYLENVYGQPGDSDLTRYKCLYFMHQDHKTVEAWAGKSLPQGRYSTFYAATFDTQDEGKRLRMKTYAYDEQNGFSDWDVKWLQECKRRLATQTK